MRRDRIRCRLIRSSSNPLIIKSTDYVSKKKRGRFFFRYVNRALAAGRFAAEISANRTRPRGAVPSAPDTARRPASARAANLPFIGRGRLRDNPARRARSRPIASRTTAMLLRLVAHLDRVVVLDQIGRDVDALAVHRDVAVIDELARGERGDGEFHAIDHRVEPALQQARSDSPRCRPCGARASS